jgi:spore germination protein
MVRRGRRGAAWGVALAAVLTMTGCGTAGNAAPKPRPAVRAPKNPPPEVVGFWASGTDQSLAPLPQYPGSVTVFSPYFYSIEPNGAIVSHVDNAVLSQARSLHLAVVPLFNTPGPQTFLGSIFDRIQLARTISGLVRQQHYQGVDLDFEPAETAYAAGLAAFVIDLHDFLPRGSRLYLDLVPASGAAYRFSAMTPDLTAYILMSYDQHDDGSVPGPVAATDWVAARIRRLLAVAPANKVDMGLAFYGYDWQGGTTHAVTLGLNYIPAAAQAHAHYDPTTQEMTATYTDATGLQHVVWWETPQGLMSKLQLARRLNLHGVAIWRLGYQTPATLGLLQQYRGVGKSAGTSGGKR